MGRTLSAGQAGAARRRRAEMPRTSELDRALMPILREVRAQTGVQISEMGLGTARHIHDGLQGPRLQDQAFIDALTSSWATSPSPESRQDISPKFKQAALKLAATVTAAGSADAVTLHGDYKTYSVAQGLEAIVDLRAALPDLRETAIGAHLTPALIDAFEERWNARAAREAERARTGQD